MTAAAPAKRRRLIAVIITSLLVVGALFGAYAARGEQDAFATLERQGLRSALDTLERAAARDSAVLRDGHQLAHALGRRAVERSRGDASVLGQCRPIFASGCYHGVVESFLQSAGRIDMAELERMCSRAGTEESPAPVYECMHGLGHGVLGAVGRDVRPALHHCDAVSGERFAASCREGVFMEAINSAVAQPHHHAGDHGVQLSLDPRNSYAPCDRFGDPYADSCWLFQGFLILRSVEFDPGRAFATCDGAPEERRGRCYESLGHQLTGLFQRDDMWIREQCSKGRKELAPRCATGAVLALTGMDWSGARAAGFCAGSPVAWMESCYRTTGEMLAVLATPGRRAEVCGRIQQPYARACLADEG